MGTASFFIIFVDNEIIWIQFKIVSLKSFEIECFYAKNTYFYSKVLIDLIMGIMGLKVWIHHFVFLKS